MKKLIDELDAALADRHLTDGDDTVDAETLRLMELRIRIETANQVETLNRRLVTLTDMLRNKF